MRYLRVGGTRQRRFAGTNPQPRNLPENAVRPTRQVHAVLGGSSERKTVAIQPIKVFADLLLFAKLPKAVPVTPCHVCAITQGLEGAWHWLL